MLRSAVPTANSPATPFPLNNLPYVSFTPSGKTRRIGVAIGSSILDLYTLSTNHTHLFTTPALPSTTANDVLSAPTLNPLLALPHTAWKSLRSTLQSILSDTPENAALLQAEQLLWQIDECQLHLPADIGDYTDFYSSLTHARNVGTMFRGPENALPPNWLHMPIAYHGRASSIIPSGQSFHRPKGQLCPDGKVPTFGACKLLDFELEIAALIGGQGKLGERVRLETAWKRVFGFVLMNDWSARDVQKWEYVPLGPFGGKNFATSISPFVVTLDALEPFRVDPVPRVKEVLPYLQDGDGARGHCGYNVGLEVAIKVDKEEGSVVCRSNMRNLYWTVAQQIAHHSVTGCNLRPGDLLASGTISGEEEQSFGSLLELSWKGSKDVPLDNCGETRKFLKDGDTVVITGTAKGEGYCIGFGECSGTILPAVED